MRSELVYDPEAQEAENSIRKNSNRNLDDKSLKK